MAELNRRSLLRGSAVVAGSAIVGGPFLGFVARDAAMAAGSTPAATPVLEPVADLRDGAVRLWLPKGFQYRSFHDNEYGPVLDGGGALPGRHDGMGAFRGPDGTTILVRNHEVANAGVPFGDVATAYDKQARGGTTTVRVTRHGEVLSTTASVNGTMSNCSGGIMPWGSWITCEETVNGPDVGPDFTGRPNVSLEQRHGFIFEVPVRGQSDGEPITAAGRFAHESVAFDPRSGYLYLTEDNFGFPSGFYRYKPPRHPGHACKLADGGRLQMLAVRRRPNLDLAADQRRHATYRVEWVDIDDPAPSFPYTPGEVTPTTNDTALTHVARQGWAQGAAYFSRLEGSVYEDGVVYFTATQGGGPAETSIGPIADGYGNGQGQVWAYHCASSVLRLVYQSPGPGTLDFPDNITTSPRGTLVLCEDNVNDNYIRGLTRGGRLFDIALNRLVGKDGTNRSNDEFAGSTFSPDGHTLFVNIQATNGMTFAIWGDWRSIGV
ncbi:MAG TPA: hypothetical protein DGT23_12665 [Micromonosporaceae bacterium]|nr:hypothetical protein [Micromonosporaceae bacterium]